jgi:hypothetical protein
VGAGEHIRLILDDATRMEGTFQSADNRSITLAVGGRGQENVRGEVRQVFLNVGTNRPRHVGLAVAAGAAAGLIVFGDGTDRCRRTSGPPSAACGSPRPPAFVYSTGIGAAVGALIPATRLWKEIYIRTPVTP